MTGLIVVHEAESPANPQFHLRNGKVSMILGVAAGKLVNLYTGAPLPDRSDFGYLLEDRFRVLATVRRDDDSRYVEFLRQEFPEYGRGDFRLPAISVAQPNGSRITDLAYAGYRVADGKPELDGLPSTYANEGAAGRSDEGLADAQTLLVDLADDPTGLTVTLAYTIFRDEPVIARSAVIRNGGREPLDLERVMSLNLDLPDRNWTMTEFMGAWARERRPYSQPLHPGVQGVGSLRGASSPFANPSAIFARPNTDEDQGEAFGVAFVYSGNFDLHAEVDTFDATRIQLGINDFGFTWRLEPGESFQAPEALLAYSSNGLNALSHAFHNIVRGNLARGPWKGRERPVLINNWEATYFDFTEDKLLALARTAWKAGIELFVLDDGWFGKGPHARVTDNAGLGDWTPNPDRLPDGIAGIARKVNELGMRFGLWFEPEMVNKASDLYTEHPDWVLATTGRGMSVYRHQYVLNFANPAVVNNIYSQLHTLLSGANIAYIKWDMNRFITEAFDATRGAERQGEVLHRYILGVYELYRRLLAAFPELIIEGCSSGGARFDLGILAYSPQIWTSDDTDAVERLGVQWGTSYIYPVEAMGAHVSITPNHQTGRSEPIDTRANVAMFGTFGYEMDLNRTSAEDLEAIRSQVAFFKRFGPLIHWGDFYRLRSPFAPDRRSAAWMTVARDGSEALVADFTILMQPNRPNTRLALRGLDPAALYEVRTVDAGAWDWAGASGTSGPSGVDGGASDVDSGDGGAESGEGAVVRSGAELMRIGLNDTDLGGRDFASRLYLITRL